MSLAEGELEPIEVLGQRHGALTDCIIDHFFFEDLDQIDLDFVCVRFLLLVLLVLARFFHTNLC